MNPIFLLVLSCFCFIIASEENRALNHQILYAFEAHDNEFLDCILDKISRKRCPVDITESLNLLASSKNKKCSLPRAFTDVTRMALFCIGAYTFWELLKIKSLRYDMSDKGVTIIGGSTEAFGEYLRTGKILPGITVYEVDKSGLFVTNLEGIERKVPSEEVKKYLIKYFAIAAGIWSGLSLFEYFRKKHYCNKFIAKVLHSQNIIIDQGKLSKSAEKLLMN